MMPPSPALPRPRRDRRGLAIALTLAAIALGGWGLNLWNERGASSAAQAHAEEALKAEVDLRFQQGVVMLHAREYEHAMTAFHRVLQLAPRMPEAHVNAGFALAGQKRFKEALAFFDSATELRKEQANAYYGMAIALEGMGDLRGALAAMEAFLHRAKADDPYRRKAESAVWEWRAQLSGKTPPPGTVERKAP